MNNNSKVCLSLPIVSLLAFMLFVAYILYINLDVLYTAHDRSEFLYGISFLHTLLSEPFGVLKYVGAWLTQLFYYPYLGAGVLMAIWTSIIIVGRKAFRLQKKATALMILPVACLLTSIVDLGYWIYISPIRGYWFSQSVGYLIMLSLLWAANNTPRHWHLAWYFLALCLYPVLGWFSILFVLCLVVTEKPTWREIFGIVMLFFIAIIWRLILYSNMKIDDVMLAGFPRFSTISDSSEHLSIPFWLLGGISILISIFRSYLEKAYVSAVCAVTAVVFTCSFMYSSRSYTDEMRMVRFAEDDKWSDVIKVASENTKPTATIVMLKNLALMNEGGLLETSFKTGNIIHSIDNRDSIHIGFLEIAASLACYNYGMINESIRLNFDNAVQTGFSPYYLKMLSRCAKAYGEKELTERYVSILRHNMFYGNWSPADVTEKIVELQSVYPEEIIGVESADRYIINNVSQWSGYGSKLASEQALFYSMMRCDSRRFWASLREYVKLHKGGKFPLHAQEAYIMYTDKAPEEKRLGLPVEQAVFDRYKNFWKALEHCIKSGMSKEKIPAEMVKEWGDTYWYYNVFLGSAI